MKAYISAEQLDSIMPEGEYVHTFIQGGPALIGADQKRSELLSLASKEEGAELSGATARGLNHGVVVWDGDGAVFIETVEDQVRALEISLTKQEEPVPACYIRKND